MIKRFIKKIEESSNDAMVAILEYIDKALDRHDKVLKDHRHKIEKLEDELHDLKNNFDPVKAKIDSDSKNRESRVKHIVNTVIALLIAAIFGWLGLK